MDNLKRVTDGFSKALSGQPAIDASIRIDFPGLGSVRIADGSVSNSDLAADSVVTVSLADFDSIATGELDPISAFMTGRVRLAGPMKPTVELGRRLARSRNMGII
jgi:putative sterol carrier protein